MKGQFLDPNSPLPRYYQIYSALLNMIETGELAAGQPLPPERQIADSFCVARPTVVKALDLLEREGRLTKQQGRGNIVLDQQDKAKTIAFVSTRNMTDELLMAVSQTAFKNNYHLQILGIDDEFTDLKSAHEYIAS